MVSLSRVRDNSLHGAARGLVLLLAALWLSPAQAVPSSFGALLQVVAPNLPIVSIQNNRFERQVYVAAGALVSFEPWVWDAQKREWVYSVQPGESWVWVLRDMKTGYMLASHGVHYVGGEDMCWSDGACGPYTWRWVAWPLQCMPEEERYKIEIYHDNLPLGADYFRPTRFVPKIEQASLLESIAPKRTTESDGDATEIAVYLRDDLDCGQPIKEGRVKLAAMVTGGTNGQTYFTHGDIGTGKFSSLGFNSTLNPGGAGEKDTVIEGDSNDEGIFKARYQAHDHDADENIRIEVERPATDDDPKLTGEPADEALRIAVPGLVRITHDNAPLAFADGGTCPHDPSPHWLTPNTRSRVMTLASIYHLTTGRLLSLNDASLPYGGVLATRRVSSEADLCHGSHRQGIDIDFNSVDRLVGTPGQEPPGENMRTTNIDFRGEQWALLDYVDFWAEKLGGTDYHGTNSIHYRFPN